MPLTIAEFIDEDMSRYLNNKPDWSIFRNPLNADRNKNEDNEFSLIEPEIASSIILNIKPHRKEYDLSNNKLNRIDFYNFKANYQDFQTQCKIKLTFNIRIKSDSDLNLLSSSFNVMIKPYSNKTCFDKYTENHSKFDATNIYSKIKHINLISMEQIQKIYKVNILLAVTEKLKEFRKNIKLYICLNEDHKNSSCTVAIPITYFSILQHTFIQSINDLYDIIILNDIYSLIMELSGKLHWYFGEPFIWDTLDISQEKKMNQFNIDKINKGINPSIKNIYCLTSMNASYPIQTKLNGINLLLINTDIDKIEIVTESIKCYTDYVVLKHKQYKEDDDQYNSGNNAILKKYLALDIDSKLLKNVYGKLDFMLWIEWEQSKFTGFKWENWRKKLCNNSLNNLIDWYEMKRIRNENNKKLSDDKRIKSVKQQRKARQKSKQRHPQYQFSKNNYNNHCHKRYLYNRW